MQLIGLATEMVASPWPIEAKYVDERCCQIEAAGYSPRRMRSVGPPAQGNERSHGCHRLCIQEAATEPSGAALVYPRPLSHLSNPTRRPDPTPFFHSHQFSSGNAAAEKNTLRAVYITAAMMVVEVIGGYVLNSMALLADGWHMSSHALALGLSVAAYALARRLAHDRRFAFGTWKIEILGGYSSALLLGVVAALMMFQSVERLFVPGVIHYDEAILIACLGLAVNLLCAWLLRDAPHDHGHTHDHDHGSHHAHAEHHHDINLRAAYLHVIADAATSVLAILALLGGKLLGASWLDPAMGIVGSVLVARWAWALLKQSGRVLLDAEMDSPVVEEVREVIAEDFPTAALTDLHVWRVGKGQYACIVALASPTPLDPGYVREKLRVHEELVHVTVETIEVGQAGRNIA